MTKREQFINYVKQGGEKPIASPQIGAGAGFDAKLAGKKSASMQDTVNAAELFDMLPLYNFGLDFSALSPLLKWTPQGQRSEGHLRVEISGIQTPYGDLISETAMNNEGDSYRTKAPVTCRDDFDKFNWYLDTLLEGDYGEARRQGSEADTFIGGRGAIDFQWGMQPYELFSMSGTLDTVLLAMDYAEDFIKLMDKCAAISKKIIDALAPYTDFVFLGGPAAEMVSPDIYDKFMVPYGKMMTDYAHSKGLLIYSHVCSPIEPFLTMGYFNRLGIDLFETLSMPPVGNVKSIEDAFSKLDPAICTRGNIGIDTLMNETPDEIKRQVNHIMEAAVKMKRKHMVAASDYLLAECKKENVQALCDAVREF
ncbi:hypothetical protein FACS1894141_3840 [Spirochaetia bacterium]|nr:hypothetical protein FACS1894141_3840 [Spirochaetia bacterium]